MPQPTYKAPGFDSVYQDPQYQQGLGVLQQGYQQSQNALNQQLGGIQSNYSTRRSDLIRSYQDSLDAINESLRQAGIGIRGNYADRGLYNASGDVSGIGQGYATNILNPIYNTLQQTQSRQTQDLNALSQNQAQDVGNIQQQLAGLGTEFAQNRFNLANQIFESLRNAARQQFEDRTAQEQTQYERGRAAEQTQYDRRQQEQQRPQENPASRIYNEALGRQYLGTMGDVQNAIRQFGRDAVTQIGGNYFLLSPQERQQLGLFQSGSDPLGIL